MSNTKSAESTLSEPIFNRQALVRLILPLLAEQFLSVSMGMADTLMVSGVGEAAVSSVSLVDSLNILIIQILSALATGGAVISSQYLGRRDGEKAAKSAAQLYTVLAVSTIAVMLVILVLSRPILRIVFGRIDDDVMSFSQTYFFDQRHLLPLYRVLQRRGRFVPCAGQQPHFHAGQPGHEHHQYLLQRPVHLWAGHGGTGRCTGHPAGARVCRGVGVLAAAAN